MSGAVSIRRKNRVNLLRESRKLASFDEFPLLRPEVDPQVHASRNEVDQPFYLVCEKDTVVAQIRGASRLVFAGESVNYYDMEQGDFVYVPAGAPHRVLVQAPGEMIRYKASEPGLEAVRWLCERCGNQLDEYAWDNSSTLPQASYLAACERHNADEPRRQCAACGHRHDPIDLTPFQWDAVAESLSRVEEDDD